MVCKYCTSEAEMDIIAYPDEEATNTIHWCDNCGTLFTEDIDGEEEWERPKQAGNNGI